jgi:hypothetical protein
MKVKSLQIDDLNKATELLDEVVTDGFSPTLALVFLSIRQERVALCKLLVDRGYDVFGATTAGEFIDGEVAEGSAVIMLMDMKREHYLIQLESIGDGTRREAASRIAVKGKESFTNPAYLITSGGSNDDGDLTVKGIQDISGPDVVMFGGLAGDDFTKAGTWAFKNNEATNDGVVALIIDQDRVHVSGITSNGWKPVGTIRTITKSDKNVVYTIDDLPALDVLVQFMGIEDRLEKWNDVMISIGSEYPLQLLRDPAPPIIRAPLYANMQDRSLTCAGNVPEGSKVRFSLPPSFDVIEKVIEECQDFHKIQNDVEAVLMFSCKTRHVSLGPLIGEEIDGVKAIWDQPFIGFFSYGEIGRCFEGEYEYHNNTCAVVLLKER